MAEQSLVETVAGTLVKFSASTPATYDAAGFNALVFTEIGELTDLPTYGKKYNVVKHNSVRRRNTVKRRGSYDNGAMSLKVGRVPTDAGQILAKTANDSDDSISVSITYPSGEKHYFTAQMTAFMIENGTVDNIQKATIDIELDNDIVED